MHHFDPNAIERKNKERDELVIDGRTARRNRNRNAVLDALIALADEGHIDPPIDLIAERAGVSYRSVYRYFVDRTELMLAATSRVLDGLVPMFEEQASSEGDFEDRLAEFIDARIAAYRAMAPLTRQVTRLSLTEPTVAEGVAKVRAQLRGYIERWFAPELEALPDSERGLAFASIDVGIQFEALEHLVRDHGLDDAQLQEVLRRHVRAHLAVVTPAES